MGRTKSLRREFPVAKTVVFVILAIYAFSLIFPMLWAILASLKDQIEYTTYNVNGLPQKWLFSNYLEAFKVLSVETEFGKQGILALFLNSTWYSVGAAFIGIAVSSMSAYVVAKYKFPGKKLIFSLVVISMMIPIVGSLPSQMRIVTSLGLNNNPLFLLTFAGGMGFNFLVLHGYFESLSWSFAEAAFIDGAGHVRVFFSVMMPQAVQLFSALGILALIGAWNDYQTPLLFLKDYPTLSSGLFIFQTVTQRIQNLPVLYAGILISAVPVIVLFSVFSGTIMDITLTGGLKG